MLEQGIGGAGKAHIDDAHGVVGRPLQALVESERRTLGDAGLSSKAVTANSSAPGAMPVSLPCDTMAPAIEVPWGCGLSLPATASKFLAMLPSRSASFEIDAQIDHRDADGFPGGDLLRLPDLQFVQNILGAVAQRAGRRLGDILLQGEQEIRLHAGDAALVAQRTHQVRHRGARTDAPAVQR